jgi:hypothetical protein
MRKIEERGKPQGTLVPGHRVKNTEKINRYATSSAVLNGYTRPKKSD